MTDLRDHLRTYFDALTDDLLADELAPTPRRAFRSRGAWLAAAAAVVVIALVAAWLVLASGSGDNRVQIAGVGRTVVQLVGYGDGSNYQDLVFVDPETGTARRIPLSGSCFCHLVVLDGTVWGDDNQGVFRVDAPYGRLTRVDAGRGTLFRTLDGSGVWVASGLVGSTTLRKIDTSTNAVGRSVPLPAGYTVTDPPSAVVGGILLISGDYPRTLSIWDPGTGVRELATNVGILGAVHTSPGAHSSQVMYRDAQEHLHIVDTASGQTVPITVNGTVPRTIGGGAFSPDGRTVAAFMNVSTSDVGRVTGGRIAQVMLVDAATGAGRVIEHQPVEFGEEYAWATWASDGSRVFFGAGPFEESAFAVGLRDTSAIALPVASNYTWTALDVPAPSHTEPPPTPNSTGAPVSQTGAVTAIWTPMYVAEGAFPSGAGVTSVAEFGDRLIAAGNVYGSNVAVANPVVWTSTNGGAWQRTWDTGTMVGGSSSNPHLAVLGDSVWIFHHGTGGTNAWRSTDGQTWQTVTLPDVMTAVSVVDAAERDGVIVAVGNDKFGRGDVLWRSEDGGATWERLGAALGANANLTSVVVTNDGFAIGGVDVGTERPLVWSSGDGRAWSRTELSTNQGGVRSVGAIGNVVVAKGVVGSKPALWYRTNDSWVQADTAGSETATLPGTTNLQVLRSGFVSYDRRPDALRLSRDGTVWLDVVSTNAPGGSIAGGGASGDAFVAFVDETNAAGTRGLRPYRVDFAGSK